MTRRSILLLLVLIPLCSFTVHKYYISLTKIDFIEDQQSVQITMRFFIDDIETTLNNRFQTSLELATEKEHLKTDEFIEKYIGQKFNVIINDERMNFKFIGKEYDNDVVYFYLEIMAVEAVSKIEVQNSMLMEDLPEQENFIRLNINNTKKILVLRKGNDKEMLNY